MPKAICPEEIRDLGEAKWYFTKTLGWVLKGRECYGTIVEVPPGFDTRIFGLGDRIESEYLDCQLSLEKAKKALENRLIKLGQVSVQWYKDKSSRRIQPLIVYKLPSKPLLNTNRR